MKWLFFIFLLALIPALLSIVLVRRAKQRFNHRMRRIRQRYQNYQGTLPSVRSSSVEYYQDTIGDITCRYNARSPYIRCAINPCGPCEDCSSYQAID